MVAQAQFSDSAVAVVPGDEVTLTLTVTNSSETTESYSVVATGMTAGWVQIGTPTLLLFGGSSETMEVTIRPPRLASTTAGSVTVPVRVVPHGDPNDAATAEVVVSITAFDDRQVHILQPVQRARRRAVYEVVVENQGNQQASCRLHLVDTTGRLDGEFDPPSLGIEPGANSLAQLRLKAVRRRWKRSTRFLPFTVEADQQGHDTASADATLVQVPVLPDHFWRRAVGLLVAAGLIVGAWFGVVRPALDDAAKDAVDERISELTATSVGSVPSGTNNIDNPSGSTVVTVVPTANEGTPFVSRLAPEVAVGTTNGALYTADAATTVLITDLVLQNPNLDLGRAVLLRNADVLYQWNLSNSLSTEPLPLVTPLELKPGENLTFQVTCDRINDGTATACTTSLTILGRLVPAA